MKVPFETLLCATDLSPLGNLAVDVAYRLLADGGTLHLLHVDAPPKRGNPLYPDERPSDAPTDAEIAAHRASLRARLSALIPATAAGRRVKFELDLVEGEEVALSIEEEAKRRSVAAVVLSSHGQWGLSRLLRGESVAIRLLHRRDLDVVIVHTDRP
jgi:nucleotide-binding universal stress UspA family protein